MVPETTYIAYSAAMENVEYGLCFEGQVWVQGQWQIKISLDQQVVLCKYHLKHFKTEPVLAIFKALLSMVYFEYFG